MPRERSREDLVAAEAVVERDLQHRRLAQHQLRGGTLQAQALDVAARSLTGGGLDAPLQRGRREARCRRQRGQAQVLVEAGLDVYQDRQQVSVHGSSMRRQSWVVLTFRLSQLDLSGQTSWTGVPLSSKAVRLAMVRFFTLPFSRWSRRAV